MRNFIVFLSTILFLSCSDSKKYYHHNLHNKTISEKYSDSSVLEEIKDSIGVVNIKPGFYYRYEPIEVYGQEMVFYNEINWLYVSKNHTILNFKTANYEGCLTNGINSKKTPKGIYRQIRNRPEKIEEIPFGCRELLLNSNQIKNESVIFIDTLISYSKNLNDIRIQEEMIFRKNSLIRSISSNSGELILLKYHYLGK